MAHPLPQPTLPTTYPTTTATRAQIHANLDLLISLALHAWPALSLAVQNSWGGPTSIDKRDWFCGAVSELLATNQLRDQDDLGEVLLQVMNDEFEVVVDDGSADDIAAVIWKGWDSVSRGNFDGVCEMAKQFESRRAKGSTAGQKWVNGGEEVVEGSDEDGEEDEDEYEDEMMQEAPQLVETDATRRRERIEPEVDEDGFTTVVGRRKR